MSLLPISLNFTHIHGRAERARERSERSARSDGSAHRINHVTFSFLSLGLSFLVLYFSS